MNPTKEEKIMAETNSSEKFKHLSKLEKNILQCISCGDCRELTDNTLDPPNWGVCVAREHTTGFEPFFGRGKMQIIRSLWQGKLELSEDMANVIFQCPTCNACSKACYYGLNTVDYYEALRAELVDAGCALDVHNEMNQGLLENLNPYGQDNAQKKNWLDQLDFTVKDASSEPVEVLYFTGCTAALSAAVQPVAINTAKVLHKLGIDFGVLGGAEICCGSVAMRTGARQVFQEIAEKNAALFQKIGVKTIITSCAGCYRTLKIDYKDMLEGSGIEVMHTVEFLEKYLRENGIQLKNLGIHVTYHDPCHTGRHIGLYEPPRALLRQMATLTEMKNIKEHAKCCGAGGGVKKAFPQLALDIAKTRIQEAEETGADYIVSICPFCDRNLADAIQETGSAMQVKDLLELVEQALE